MKLKVNHNDVSLVNRKKFYETVDDMRRGKQLNNYIMILKSGIIIVGMLVCFYTPIFSKDVNSSVKSKNSYSYETTDNMYFTDDLASLFSDNKFEVGRTNIYDEHGSPITLVGEESNLNFITCNVNTDTLKNSNLRSSNTESIDMAECCITNDFVKYLPQSLLSLNINRCFLISDLSALPDYCPNIVSLSMKNLGSIDNLDFIYRLKSLKSVYLGDSACIDQKLLDYLYSQGIKTDITQENVLIAENLDAIIAEIIKPGMSDSDKIRAVTSYIMANIQYDKNYVTISDTSPLKCIFKNGKAVCTGFSYFTNVLLNKAGINSFSYRSPEYPHEWPIAEIDNDYYAVDTTFLNYFQEKVESIPSQNALNENVSDANVENIFKAFYLMAGQNPSALSIQNLLYFNSCDVAAVVENSFPGPDFEDMNPQNIKRISMELATDIISNKSQMDLIDKYGIKMTDHIQKNVITPLFFISLGINMFFLLNSLDKKLKQPETCITKDNSKGRGK